MERRVVITGMGIYSCIGNNTDMVREALYNEKSGVVFQQERLNMGFECGLTGYLEDPQLNEELTRNQRIYMSQHDKYAYVATKEALQNAGLDADYIETHTVGLVFGNDSSFQSLIEGVDNVRKYNRTRMAGSGSFLQSLNSTVSMNLGCLFKLRGINLTTAAACASSGHSIGLASVLICQGLQDCIVCGGAQEVNAISVAPFDGMGAFSSCNDSPATASKPFDRRRDGLVPSGGAATVVLESYESAIRRSAPILAEVIGYGFSGNGEHLTKPSIDGQLSSMNNAITQAGISKKDIGYINAHATSTQIGDSYEAISLYNLFADDMPPVTSTKGFTGHELSMAGASGVIYSILMMKGGFIAPSLNFSEPDEVTCKLNICQKRLDSGFKIFLSNSFGFGGTNSTLIIKNHD